MAKEPGYCRHKPTNQAYIRLDGKPYYLGEYGSELSKERYNRLKAEWLSNRHSKKFQPKSSTGPTVSDICYAYLDHAEVYYSASKEYKHMELACGPMSALYATLPAKDFGIPEFEACREGHGPQRDTAFIRVGSCNLNLDSFFYLKGTQHLFRWVVAI